MLKRLSPLALVLLAACERAPDYSSCPIVGTWQYVIPKPDTPGASGPFIFEEVFRPDGTWRTDVMAVDRAWKPVVVEGARVVVEYPAYFVDGASRSRAFEFDGNDKTRELETTRTWVRVKDAK